MRFFLWGIPTRLSFHYLPKEIRLPIEKSMRHETTSLSRYFCFFANPRAFFAPQLLKIGWHTHNGKVKKFPTNSANLIRLKQLFFVPQISSTQWKVFRKVSESNFEAGKQPYQGHHISTFSLNFCQWTRPFGLLLAFTLGLT